MSLDLVGVILGMKIRQAREEAGLNLSECARLAELSPSYLTEIEKGRKYPRADKILRLAQALGKDYDELVSIRLHPSLQYLESALSSSIFRRFPFEEFGLEPADLVGLLTRRPDRASALLHALLEVSRLHGLQEEDFFRAALRSYQEIYENYFPELEEAASELARDFPQAPPAQALSLSALEGILKERYGVRIDYESLKEFPELSSFRSVLAPGRQPRLMVNPRLHPKQIRFVLARELGYHYLQIEERSLTSTPHRISSFQQILNDFRAAYLGGALLMPKQPLLEDLERFFEERTFRPSVLLAFLQRYEVTPEMLLYRFSELIPQFFGLKLHFLRFQHRRGSQSYRLVKYLNMNDLLMPSGVALREHYCRRWLSIRLLGELESEGAEELLAGAQLSEFVPQGDRFLCFGFARPLVLCPDVASSVVVGFRLEGETSRTIRFLADPALPRDLISQTCERCPLNWEQCDLRAAEATLLQEGERAGRIQILLQQLATRLQSSSSEHRKKKVEGGGLKGEEGAPKSTPASQGDQAAPGGHGSRWKSEGFS